MTASAEEIATELEGDLKRLNVDRKHFTDKILKDQRLTLYEWTEDVLRTKVLLGKLCRTQVTVSQEDLQMAYDSYYGEKVQCRFILWPKGEEKHALLEYAKIRDDEQEFRKKAKMQASPTLAAKGGELGPVSRHTTGNEELEKEIFSLQPGEVSRLIGTPEGIVIVRCDARIPANESVKLDAVRAKLNQEVFERKVQAAMPQVFGELRTPPSRLPAQRPQQAGRPRCRGAARIERAGIQGGGRPGVTPKGN